MSQSRKKKPVSGLGQFGYHHDSEVFRWKVSEWLAASLEMKCPIRGCEFESRAFRFANNLGTLRATIQVFRCLSLIVRGIGHG